MTALAIFAYNRPEHLQSVVKAVLRQSNKPEAIVAFVDGKRSPNDPGIDECCNILKSIDGISINKRESSYGCAKNIVKGIDSVLADFDKVTVLEDDVVPEPHWFESMCLLLDRYESDLNIAAVGGFPSLLNGALQGYQYDVVFSSRFCPWGWGTWRDKWSVVSGDLNGYYSRSLSFGMLPTDAGNDVQAMLAADIDRKLWDAVVVGSFLVRGMKQVSTRNYLVRNIGASIHLRPDKLEFMYDNNRLVDIVPANLPDLGDVDVSEIMGAVRAYVAAMS